MSRPIPLSVHPELVDQSFAEPVPVVEESDSGPRPSVLARRRIGEDVVLPRAPFVNHVSGVDVDQQEHRAKVVMLNLMPQPMPAASSVSVAASTPAVAPAAKAVEKKRGLSALADRVVGFLPPPLARHALWSRNLFLGATLSFADASLSALSPVAFLWRNLSVVSLGLLYLSIPLVPSLALLYHVPALGQAYAPNTLVGGVYLVGLYLSCSVVLMATALTSGFIWRGTVRLMNHFARTGAQAFPTR